MDLASMKLEEIRLVDAFDPDLARKLVEFLTVRRAGRVTLDANDGEILSAEFSDHWRKRSNRRS